MPTLEETTRYFDEHASRLRADRLVDKSAALSSLVFDRISPGSEVLEVGAGTGLYTQRLLSSGHRVTAVDLSASGLEQIRAHASAEGWSDRLVTLHGAFPSVFRGEDHGRFRAVLFIKVLHHFPDRAAIREALHRAYDLLAPGGRLFVFEPNGSYPLWAPLLLARGLQHFRNERNVFLIRRRFLAQVFDELPGITHCRYRFVVPGGLVQRVPALARIDEALCDHRRHPFGGRLLLDKLAVNICFETEKPATSPHLGSAT